MGNNNEDQKPIRKTWTMLKIARPEIPFSSDIIPIFNSKNYTKTNEWGTWTISATGANGSTWYMFDGDDKTGWNIRSWEDYYDIFVTLDGGYGICPTKISVIFKTKKIYIHGYNPETGVYEPITSGQNPSAYDQTLNYANEEANTYYTKFRIRSADGYGLTSSIRCFKLLSGKLKRMN